MGYTTDFEGSFSFDRVLDENHFNYLMAFATCRHMTWDAKALEDVEDEARTKASLPLGIRGMYFTAGEGWDGPGHFTGLTADRPANGVPSRWCQWIPVKGEEKTLLEWDKGEKFYRYELWLEFIIEHFTAKWGYVLNGKVLFQGEDPNDTGYIEIKDNIVTVIKDDADVVSRERYQRMAVTGPVQ